MYRPFSGIFSSLLSIPSTVDEVIRPKAPEETISLACKNAHQYCDINHTPHARPPAARSL